MNTRPAVIIAVLLFPLMPATGQSRLETGLPQWADSALVRAGLGSRYDLASRLNPGEQFGDFDGDGLLDLAVPVVEIATRKHGLAIVHRVDQSTYILAAGQLLGAGEDDFEWLTGWGVDRLRSHRDAIRVDRPGHPSAWAVWNGHSYSWVENPD
jgi:hypothetical protein